MTDTIRLLSVNVSELAPLRPDLPKKRTGIHKRPTGERVAVRTLGMDGDRVGNTKHHGGADQALYLYSAEDYAWWSAQLGIDCQPGLFGENLTLDRWWDSPRIGDRLVFGNITLELTAPRIPCSTLATRMGMPTFVKRFAEARRPGAYVRVLSEGTIATGAPGTVNRSTHTNATLATANAVWFETPRNQDVMRTLLHAPLAVRYRAALTHWLDGHV